MDYKRGYRNTSGPKTDPWAAVVVEYEVGFGLLAFVARYNYGPYEEPELALVSLGTEQAAEVAARGDEGEEVDAWEA
jgi:hypothetical protein